MDLTRVDPVGRRALDDGGDLPIGLRDRRPAAQPRHPVVPVVRAVRREGGSRGATVLLGVRLHRNPGFGRAGAAEVERHLEAGRHHADHYRRAAVHLDLASDDRRIAAEAPLPERVAEHDHVGTVDAILLGREAAADRGRHAEHAEQIVRHERRAHALRLVAADVDGAIAPQCGVLECRHVGVERLELVVREPRLIEAGPRAPEDGHAIRLAIGEWRQQHRLDHAEKRRGRPNADGQGERRDQREARAAPHRPDRVVHILPEVGGPARAALIADLLLHARHAAEVAPGAPPRLVRREPLAFQTTRFHVQVEAELLGHLVVHASPRDQRPEPLASLVIPRHRRRPQ